MKSTVNVAFRVIVVIIIMVVRCCYSLNTVVLQFVGPTLSGISQLVGPGFGNTLVLAGISILRKIIKYVVLTYSVGIFWYQKGGNCPLFSSKGGNGPLVEEHSPPFEEKRGERYKKGGGTYKHT